MREAWLYKENEEDDWKISLTPLACRHYNYIKHIVYFEVE